MQVDEVIAQIKGANAPSRHLDAEVALVLGYKKVIESAGAAISNGTTPKAHWVNPEGQIVSKLPYYTSDIMHAYMLANQIAPDHVGGCSWEKGCGTARIEYGPYFEAATPAMALCLAALTHRKNLEKM